MRLHLHPAFAIALLLAQAACSIAQPPPEPAPDVAPWARPDYERARVAGVIWGLPDGRLDGKRSPTRYEMALALGRLFDVGFRQPSPRTTPDILVSVLSPAATVHPPVPDLFKDIPYERTYSYLWDKPRAAELVQAYPDGYFRGKRALTRGELATLAYRLFERLQNRPRPDLARANFRDVAGSEWWFGAELVAVGSGVMSGYPDRTFRGAAPATREELAVVIGRLLRVGREEIG